MRKNSLGQAIGDDLSDWTAPPSPPPEVLEGQFCRLEPVDPDRHTEALFAANSAETSGAMWTYMAYGPFDSLRSYRDWLSSYCSGSDPQFYAIVDARSGAAVGLTSYCRIQNTIGVIEIGHLCYSPLLQRTSAATESVFLLLRNAFRLGYRRCEWKCDAFNEPSRRAALRLGFTLEGVFRNATMYKRRSRDTAWYAIVDDGWALLEASYLRWLAPENFDTEGKQLTRLSEFLPIETEGGK
ncbi:MAG: GNAT family protein [Planctomycetota bacterium]